MRYKEVGLGDAIARVLEKVGIRKTAACGCDQRQSALNRIRVRIPVK